MSNYSAIISKNTYIALLFFDKNSIKKFTRHHRN
jgi:hypothetical protein